MTSCAAIHCPFGHHIKGLRPHASQGRRYADLLLHSVDYGPLILPPPIDVHGGMVVVGGWGAAAASLSSELGGCTG